MSLLLSLTLTVSQKWTLVFGGDLMFNGMRDGPQVFQNIRPILAKSDSFMANLEVPITDRGIRTRAKLERELRARTQFILRASPRHEKTLKASGIGWVSLANNHTMDYGPEGLKQESAMLDRLGIVHAGAGLNVARAESPAILKLSNGIRVGLLSVMAFATTPALRKTTPATAISPGVAVFNFEGRIDEKARNKIRKRMMLAKEMCDVLVVGVHWGVERHPVPNSYQVALGRALIQNGADIVWGNHPHVLEGAEWFDGRPILYSMGNLASALPAETGLIRIRMNGKKPVGCEFIPARVFKGRIYQVPGRAAGRARESFAQLCRRLVKKFPSTKARQLIK